VAAAVVRHAVTEDRETNMSTNINERSERKKPYVKPEVKRVMLRPEEAVLASCKTSKVSGPGQMRCNFPSACSSLAS
jgi:hypothetical protein